jgi:hypothetical protein
LDVASGAMIWAVYDSPVAEPTEFGGRPAGPRCHVVVTPPHPPGFRKAALACKAAFQ